jgi:hypothetical protein
MTNKTKWRIGIFVLLPLVAYLIHLWQFTRTWTGFPYFEKRQESERRHQIHGAVDYPTLEACQNGITNKIHQERKTGQVTPNRFLCGRGCFTESTFGATTTEDLQCLEKVFGEVN